MTEIKLCGLTRPCDIEAANELMPEYIGFVFAAKSRRYVDADRAEELKAGLHPGIRAVGVFVNEAPETVAHYLNRGIIDLAQLHGDEPETYIRQLRELTGKPLIRAFGIQTEQEIEAANLCSADYVLLDAAGGGSGKVFDWCLLERMKRPYFLAGGLGVDNVSRAVQLLHPFAVDVSSGIETDGYKDKNKMAEFISAVRKEDGL